MKNQKIKSLGIITATLLAGFTYHRGIVGHERINKAAVMHYKTAIIFFYKPY
jgi:hypothetical protein